MSEAYRMTIGFNKSKFDDSALKEIDAKYEGEYTDLQYPAGTINYGGQIDTTPQFKLLEAVAEILGKDMMPLSLDEAAGKIESIEIVVKLKKAIEDE